MQERYSRKMGSARSRRCGSIMVTACLAVLVALPVAGSCPAQAQQEAAPQPNVAMPGFGDPRRRPERPATSRLTQIRCLTELDYPPFNYAGPDGNPTGLSVELARLICE